MYPMAHHPYNSRSFFTRNNFLNLGGGLEVWRGYFQSLRPTIGRLLINVDISSALFYKPGLLLRVAVDNILSRNPGKPDSPELLNSRTMPPRERLELQRFLLNMRIEVTTSKGKKMATIKGLSTEGADARTFSKDGAEITVANYFKATNRTLKYPQLLLVKV